MALAAIAHADELDLQIELATHFPCSLGQAEHRRAMQYLIDHPDEAHPRLLTRLAEHRVPDMRSAATVLARIGRIESVPALEAVLATGEELICWEAAAGLAAHPSAAAKEALLRGLRMPKELSVVASVDALGARRDPTTCPALEALRKNQSERIRYHLTNALAAVGCTP